MVKLPYQEKYEPNYELWIERKEWSIFEGIFLILGYDPSHIQQYWEVFLKTNAQRCDTSPVMTTLEHIYSVNEEREKEISLNDTLGPDLPEYINLLELRLSRAILCMSLPYSIPKNMSLYETKVNCKEFIKLMSKSSITIPKGLINALPYISLDNTAWSPDRFWSSFEIWNIWEAMFLLAGLKPKKGIEFWIAYKQEHKISITSEVELIHRAYKENLNEIFHNDGDIESVIAEGTFKKYVTQIQRALDDDGIEIVKVQFDQYKDDDRFYEYWITPQNFAEFSIRNKFLLPKWIECLHDSNTKEIKSIPITNSSGIEKESKLKYIKLAFNLSIYEHWARAQISNDSDRNAPYQFNREEDGYSIVYEGKDYRYFKKSDGISYYYLIIKAGEQGIDILDLVTQVKNLFLALHFPTMMLI